MIAKYSIKFLAASLMSLLCFSIQATTIVHSFTIFWDSGPLDGTEVTGTFWYESDIVPVDGGRLYGDETSLGLDLTLEGVNYSADDITVVSMEWVLLGDELLFGEVFFGTDCNPGPLGGCTIGGPMRDFVFYGVPAQSFGFFDYSPLDDGNRYMSEMFIGPPMIVPLPGALLLMCSALFGLIGIARKKL